MKPKKDLDKIKSEIQSNFDKRGIASVNSMDNFEYDPEAPVKCSFSMVFDHTVWVKFCELAEELNTSPVYLTFALQEKLLLTLGRLKPDYRLTNPVEPSEPITVTLEDLDGDLNSDFGLGRNSILYTQKLKEKESSEPKDDDDDVFDTGL